MSPSVARNPFGERIDSTGKPSESSFTPCELELDVDSVGRCDGVEVTAADGVDDVARCGVEVWWLLVLVLVVL